MLNLKKLLGVTGAVVAITAIGVVASNKAEAATTGNTNVYRLYNPNTGEHFYTTSNAEKVATVHAGWNDEGTGWIAPTSGEPVYRVYNPNAKGGDHYYTKSNYEARSLVKVGWKWDNNAKPVFYSGGNVSVNVAYNPNAQSGAHNYTVNGFEQSSLLKSGWKYGAVAWKAVGYPAVSASRKALNNIVNELQPEMASLASESGGLISSAQVSASGENTLVFTFMTSYNYPVNSNTTSLIQQEFNSSTTSSDLSEIKSGMSAFGVSNPKIQIIFKNKNGALLFSTIV